MKLHIRQNRISTSEYRDLPLSILISAKAECKIDTFVLFQGCCSYVPFLFTMTSLKHLT